MPHVAQPAAATDRRRNALRSLAPGFALLAACAGPTAHAPLYKPPTTVSSAVTLADPVLPIEVESDQLARTRTTPAMLRRAYLALQMRQPSAALDATAEVLFATSSPGANEESFARYLRAVAYEMLGQPERGEYDLGRARELALDPELRRRLEHLRPTAAAPALPWSGLEIRPRNAWQPRLANAGNLLPMQRPNRVTIHHSALYFRDTRPAACAAQIQRIQREHMQNREYGDIGYHFLIDPSGRIWEGRELRWQGAHASGANNIGNIGICVLGNFLNGRDGQGPTPAQVQSMELLIVQLMQRYRFGPDAIYCHSDFKATECPGPRMTPIVQQMQRDLRQRGRDLAAADE